MAPEGEPHWKLRLDRHLVGCVVVEKEMKILL